MPAEIVRPDFHASPRLVESMGRLGERSAAFDRMAAATLARDDAAYRAAKADFWRLGPANEPDARSHLIDGDAA